MTAVLRLVRGYLLRFNRRLLVVPVLALSMILASGDPRMRSVSWMFDLCRTFLALAPINGWFFHSLEVATIPASRRQLWIAQWLLATVGVTIAGLAVRTAEVAVNGPAASHGLEAFTLVDLFGCVVSAATVFVVFAPRGGWRPQSAPWLPALAGFTVWITAPLWSSYARALLAGGVASASGVVFALVTFGLFTGGLFLGPNRVYVVRSSDSSNALAFGVEALVRGRPAHQGSKGLDSVERWVWRTLALAVLLGVVPVVVVGVITFTDSADGAPLTLIQRLSGEYLRGGETMPMMIGIATLSWMSMMADTLRFLRTQPISRPTIAATLTGAVIAVLASASLIEVSAYRIGFGLWPPFDVRALLGAMLAFAVGKSVVLSVGRGWQLAILLIGIPVIRLLALVWLSIPVLPSIIVDVAMVAVLVRLDIDLLATRSGLYRAKALPV